MNPYEEHAAGLGELQNELGGACPVFTWQGKQIRILPGTLKLKSANSPGGFSLDSDFKCTALLGDFSGKLPSSNQQIIYLGKALKLLSVNVAAGGLQVHLEANDVAQNL